jgi:hypothetical protein
MKIFIGQWLTDYDDYPEWMVDVDAVFLNEEDAKAWVKDCEDSRIQGLVDERNKQAQKRYAELMTRWEEHEALIAAGLRPGARRFDPPAAPEVFTEPQWKPGVKHQYIEVEAR